MPIIKSAIKRMRQTAVRRARNVETKRDFRGAIKSFLAAPSAETLKAAQSEIDTAVKKNVLSKNTAARRKSSLAKAAKNAGVSATTKKTVTKKPAASKTAAAKKPVAKKAAPKKADK